MGPNFGFISNCKVGCKTDFLVTADQGKKPLLREISTAKQNVPFVLWVALKLGSTLYREALQRCDQRPPPALRCGSERNGAISSRGRERASNEVRSTFTEPGARNTRHAPQNRTKPARGGRKTVAHFYSLVREAT